MERCSLPVSLWRLYDITWSLPVPTSKYLTAAHSGVLTRQPDESQDVCLVLYGSFVANMKLLEDIRKVASVHVYLSLSSCSEARVLNSLFLHTGLVLCAARARLYTN